MKYETIGICLCSQNGFIYGLKKQKKKIDHDFSSNIYGRHCYKIIIYDTNSFFMHTVW